MAVCCPVRRPVWSPWRPPACRVEARTRGYEPPVPSTAAAPPAPASIDAPAPSEAGAVSLRARARSRGLHVTGFPRRPGRRPATGEGAWRHEVARSKWRYRTCGASATASAVPSGRPEGARQVNRRQPPATRSRRACATCADGPSTILTGSPKAASPSRPVDAQRSAGSVVEDLGDAGDHQQVAGEPVPVWWCRRRRRRRCVPGPDRLPHAVDSCRVFKPRRVALTRGGPAWDPQAADPESSRTRRSGPQPAGGCNPRGLIGPSADYCRWECRRAVRGSLQGRRSWRHHMQRPAAPQQRRTSR